MAKATPFRYSATIIVFGLLAFVMVYVIMTYPEERVRLFETEGAETLTVSIENMEFVPETTETRIGSKIVWRNNDNTKHTVSFAGFASGILEPGESYTHVFDEEGTYVYYCEFHPSETGTVIVR